MLCQRCNKNIANVYLKNNINGTMTESYLCSSCANEIYGQNLKAFENINNDFISDMFNLFNFNKVSPALTSGRNVCPLCGSTFTQIAQSGKVGCGECYTSFRNELEPNVIRIHGKANHTGKIPKNLILKIGNKRKIEELNLKLKNLINEQNFEEAAVIRDEINELNRQNSQEGVV